MRDDVTVDPYVAAVVGAAESGAVVQAIAMALTSGDLVKGTPRPSQEFAEVSYELLGTVPNVGIGGPEQRARNACEREEAARSVLGTADLESAPQPPVLTLGDATVMWSGRGDGVRLPSSE